MRTIPFVLAAVLAIVVGGGTAPARAGTLRSSVIQFRCVDGDSTSLSIVGVGHPDSMRMVCDADEEQNGSCTFAADCPLCSLSTPRCHAPCFVMPHYVWMVAPLGHGRSLRIGGRTFLFRCGPTKSRVR